MCLIWIFISDTDQAQIKVYISLGNTHTRFTVQNTSPHTGSMYYTVKYPSKAMAILSYRAFL